MNRKDFFRKGLGRLVETVAEKSQEIIQTINESTAPILEKKVSQGDPSLDADSVQDYLEIQSPTKKTKTKKPKNFWENFYHPPGAVRSKTEFQKRCTGCGDCVNACPYAVLFSIGGGDGKKKFPYIDPNNNPCRLCPDTPCITACETGALMPLKNSFKIRLGKAILTEDNCINQKTQETTCNACLETCPVPKAILWEDTFPQFQKSCTGCGQCVQSCPTYPKAIRVE